jgi:phage shock protein PspC (stress-responsive transcriptional regulator)
MKTISYTLGSQTFQVQESAYAKLSWYRDSIADHFNTTEQSEAIEDIDIAIVEKLNSMLANQVDKTLLLEDIENLIRQLGTVEQITDQPETEMAEMPKKLFRDIKKWIGGVCAGLAAYFNLPNWVMRVVFIIGTLFLGLSIFIYPLLWYVLPPTRTKADQLQLRGIPVSLSSLSQTKGYTKRKVLSLAKALGIIFGLLALLFTAIAGTAFVTTLMNNNKNTETFGTTIYEYNCESDEGVTVSLPKYGNSSALIRYKEDAQEYFQLYVSDTEIVFGGNAWPFRENRQFSFSRADRSLEIFDREAGSVVDMCEVLSSRMGEPGIFSFFEKVIDIIAIDTCMDSGAVWDYKKRACLSK